MDGKGNEYPHISQNLFQKGRQEAILGLKNPGFSGCSFPDKKMEQVLKRFNRLKVRTGA
jgi:hypothetical protein